jgi:hypothetical protein
MKHLPLYTIGQRVELARGQATRGVPFGVYTIVRLMPNEGAARGYVVRHEAEKHDRVVSESMIQPRPQGLAQKVFA